ncbi:hypothetical protein EDB86DRAFT_2995805 [Lactarius hatsudake]|nr:hypothetical protein EDB86DRAFT_2995805 [Lactarius hatsudake]
MAPTLKRSPDSSTYSSSPSKWVWRTTHYPPPLCVLYLYVLLRPSRPLHTPWQQRSQREHTNGHGGGLLGHHVQSYTSYIAQLVRFLDRSAADALILPCGVPQLHKINLHGDLDSQNGVHNDLCYANLFSTEDGSIALSIAIIKPANDSSECS